MGCWYNFRLHAKRILLWRLNQVVPTDREDRLMTNAGIPTNLPIFRSFMAWRHTNLLVALPVTLFSSIWSIWGYVESLQTDTVQYLNPFGIFLWSLPFFSAPILCLAVILSICFWNQWRLTRSLLKTGWGLSFFLPFLPALFPIELLLESNTLQFYQSTEAGYIELLAVKLQLAIQYIFVVLPLILTFPSGAVRAAVRIRGLLPQSSLTSWVLVLSAPFYSLLIITGLVFLLQLLGDPLLIVGTALIAFSPWIYVIMRQHYIRPASCAADETRLDRIQQSTGLVNLTGLILVLAWAITGGVINTTDEEGNNQGFLSYADLVRMVFVGFGNGLITSIIFGDAFLRMTVTNWKMDKTRRDNDTEEQYLKSLRDGDDEDDEDLDNSKPPPPPFVSIDELFAAIEGTIHKRSYLNQSQQSAGEASSSLQSTGPTAAVVVLKNDPSPPAERSLAPSKSSNVVEPPHDTDDFNEDDDSPVAPAKSAVVAPTPPQEPAPEVAPTPPPPKPQPAAPAPAPGAAPAAAPAAAPVPASDPSSDNAEASGVAPASPKAKRSKSKKAADAETMDPDVADAAETGPPKPKKSSKKSKEAKEAKKEKKKKKDSSKPREEPSESNASESDIFVQE